MKLLSDYCTVWWRNSYIIWDYINIILFCNFLYEETNIISIPAFIFYSQSIFRTLSAFMSANQEKVWSQRGKNGRSHVILVDREGSLDTPSAPVNILKDILLKVHVCTCVCLCTCICMSVSNSMFVYMNTCLSWQLECHYNNYM